jgi:hypothetical protein
MLIKRISFYPAQKRHRWLKKRLPLVSDPKLISNRVQSHFASIWVYLVRSSPPQLQTLPRLPLPPPHPAVAHHEQRGLGLRRIHWRWGPIRLPRGRGACEGSTASWRRRRVRGPIRCDAHITGSSRAAPPLGGSEEKGSRLTTPPPRHPPLPPPSATVGGAEHARIHGEVLAILCAAFFYPFDIIIVAACLLIQLGVAFGLLRF